VRDYGLEYGADPRAVFVSGTSAGAHLAVLAALTPNNPAFQLGFAGAETSVSGAICLGGYYGSIDASNELPSSPLAYVGAEAPPVFVAHGETDTMVVVGDAQRFVDRLRSVSRSPVVYAELPGGHHGFDRFHSIRFESVVDAIEAFAAWVRSRAGVKPQLAPAEITRSAE
jgi:acetyl esterase/lipase